MTRLALPFHIGLEGWMKFECYKADWIEQKPGLYHLTERPGSRRVAVDWMKNQILNSGRNHAGTNSGFAGAAACAQVGTSGNAPTPSETQLVEWVQGTSDDISTATGTSGVSPWYGYNRTTYRFPPGAMSNENLSEAGVGWGTSGTTLFSRARIVDALGDDTTVTPLVDEYLDMTYELRYYAPEYDVFVPNACNLNGDDFDITIRASSVGTVLALYIGSKMGQVSTLNSDWNVWDGDLGTVEQAPNGLSASCTNDDQYDLAYQNNSYAQDMQCDCGASGWNLTGGFRSMRIRTTAGNWQIRFEKSSDGTKVQKDASFTMAFTYRLHWAARQYQSNWTMEAASDAATPAAGNWNTNLAQTTLRINWGDNAAEDQQLALRVPIGTTFVIHEGDENWVKYTTTSTYTEGADYTSFTVTSESGGSGPTVIGLQTIMAVVE